MATEAEILRLAKARGVKGPPPSSKRPAPSKPAPIEQARMNELAARISRGRDLTKVITWPGGTGKVRLRVMSVTQRDQADADALRSILDRYRGDEQNVSVSEIAEQIERARAVHYLAVVLEDEDGAPLFASPDELAELATEDELICLFNEYADHKAQVDPDLESLSEEAFDALERAIKKKDAESASAIASELPRSSLLTLVARLAS